MVRLDAKIGVCVARVWLAHDDTFNRYRFLLIVVRSECGLVKMRLSQVVAECAKNRSEGENENLT